MSTTKSPRGPRATSSASKAAAKAHADTKTQSEAAHPPHAKAAAAKSETPAERVGPDRPDPIPEGMRTLIDLFRGRLADVRFPDVDRQVLEDASEALRDADAEVARLFAELEAAQVKLSEERARLGKLAERGVAYARVFAGDDEELLATLGAIDLGTTKKPGRKPKAKAVTRPKHPKPEPVPKLLSDDKLSA